MANYLIEQETLTNIANSIREKTGDKNTLSPSEMATAISSISAGADTSDATAAADEIFAGKTAYIANGKTTGTFTIDNELSTQDELLGQLQTALNGKSSGGASEIKVCEIDIRVGVNGYMNWIPATEEIVYSTLNNSQVNTIFSLIETWAMGDMAFIGTISAISGSTIYLFDRIGNSSGVTTSDNLFVASIDTIETMSGGTVYTIKINEGDTGSIEVY